MNLEIIEEKENPLLGRKEVRFRVDYKGKTPSFEDVRNELIKKINVDRTLTIIDSVNSDFGGQTAFVYAKIYKDEESMKVEPGHRIKKNLVGKKKEEEKPEMEKPAGREEKPVEEKPAEIEEEPKPEESRPEEKAEVEEPDQEEKNDD